MSDRQRATKLAELIHHCGGEVSVPALHAAYPDSVREHGFPFSGLAAAALEEMLKLGMGSIETRECDFARVDEELYNFFSQLAGGNEKTAAPDELERIKKMDAALRPLFLRYDSALKEAAEEYAPRDSADVVMPATVEIGEVKGHPGAVRLYDQAKELEIWKDWRKTGNKAVLSDLLSRYTPIIKKSAGVFYGTPLPRSVLDAEAKRVAMEAFEHYDPRRGVKLNTFVMSYMPKVRRFVGEHQNVARIPEGWQLKITPFKQAESEFLSRHGRPPNSHELADALKWHPEDVAKMRTLLRADLITENQESSMGRQKTPGPEKAKAFIDLLHHELDNDEKLIYEHLYGLNGAETLGTSEQIAKKTNLPVAKVNQLRGRITDKAQSFIDQM